ncbi:hypothetical protein PEBR_13532 [Penicillium brasilianum]|uniref:Uncharacterized protein n=1 Tax=Penicillium brasilianum TaxID=104259 RepID=A0A1S9RS57_PENBI|nr:hypothetical protein PEBR_13532 [Penicillium brasilianum]
MVVARSNSDQRKFENTSQYPAQKTAMSGQDTFDNELFVPLGSPLPTIGAQEIQKPSMPMLALALPPNTINVVQKSKRQAPAKKSNLEPAKKKKAVVLKRGQAECDDLEFTETKPDAATIMEFPLPKINHGGIRPSRVPRYLYSTPSIPDLDDANAVEKAFRDLLSVREMVDWESRRLGRRLRLLKRKLSLEERQEDAQRAKLWEQEDNDLLQDIRRLEAENVKFED